MECMKSMRTVETVRPDPRFHSDRDSDGERCTSKVSEGDRVPKRIPRGKKKKNTFPNRDVEYVHVLLYSVLNNEGETDVKSSVLL